MSVEQYSLVAHDWLNLESIINDLTQRVVGQELHPTSSPTFGSGTITGNLAVGGDLGVTGDLAVTGGLDIDGKFTAGSFASPTDVTNTRQYGFELHYSGNNYNVTGIRSRARLKTTDTTASAQGALLQAANEDGINAGVLQGALIEAIGKSDGNAATIAVMRGALIGCEWGAYDTITTLHGLHIRIHTLNNTGAGSFGTACALTIENEAVGGDGQVLTAGIQFMGTNLSAGNKAFDYGINFGNGVEYGSADMNLSAGEIHRASVRFLKEDNTNYNIFFGTEVFNTADGTNNIGIGYRAGYYNDTTGGGVNGTNNVYIGSEAGKGNSGGSIGDLNVAMGWQSLLRIRDGRRNLMIGSASGSQINDGNSNIGIGSAIFTLLSSGSNNIGIGETALDAVNTTSNNIGIGSGSLESTIGNNSVGIGHQAGWQSTGTGGVYVGYRSSFWNTGSPNTVVGYQAGYGVNGGSTYEDCVFLGYRAGFRQTTTNELLIIDNQDRGSVGAEITNCLIYGVFNATPASQSLRLNLGTFILGNPTHSDAGGGGAIQQQFIREDGTGTETVCFQFEASHDGSGANDQLGKGVWSVNTGAGLVEGMRLDSNLDAFFTKIKLTAIGGYAIKLTNNTGANSVEGQLVEADDTDENSYKKADANALDVIGIVYNAGVADGSEVWVVIAGIAEVLLDAGGCVHHDRLISSATAGSADVSNAPAVAIHFQEIGHAIETVIGAGLAKAVLHFL